MSNRQYSGSGSGVLLPVINMYISPLSQHTNHPLIYNSDGVEGFDYNFARIDLATPTAFNVKHSLSHSVQQRTLKLIFKRRKQILSIAMRPQTPQPPELRATIEKNHNPKRESPSAHMNVEKVPLANLRNIVHNVLIVLQIAIGHKRGLGHIRHLHP
jgi:hypothetical protein